MKTIASGLVILLLSVAARGAVIGQVDDFTDGTLQNWAGASPDVGTNGPAGPGDNHLLITSNGSGSSGGKLIARNQAQWRGNYLAAGIARLTLHAKNFSGQPLQLRAVLRIGAGPAAGFASTIPVTLSTNAPWQRVVFDLNEAAMTRVNSSSLVFSDLITNVVELRILHSAAPSGMGDTIEATLGLDSIQALPVTPPALDISADGNQLRLGWLAAGSGGYVLEQTTHLTGMSAWSPFSGTTNVLSGSNVVTLPLPGASMGFFRLNFP